MTSPPDDTTTDLHAVNATLRTERNAALAREAALTEALATRTAELATRNSDYGERIEHQSATIDVLKAMSASPGDTQPVIDLICRHAQQLCNASAAAIYSLEEQTVSLQGIYAAPPHTEESIRRWRAQFPQPLSRGMVAFRAILDRRIIRVRDVDSDPEIAQSVRDLGVKSIVAIPLFREGEVIGSISINTAAGFSESQIALLQTFAEQAVIAITSAETYSALHTRTSDLQETLEYQTATSDVLKVISRSTFDLQPVLDTVVETAARLCNADQAVIYHRDGETARLAANFGFPPDYETYQKARGAIPIDTPGSAASATVRAFREGRIVHIPDVTAVPGYPDASISLGKQRTSLGVPLLREGEVIGTILLARERVEPFTDRQIELVSTFADQAVIAIENTRLITEQREALEQQTATAEVLQVINANPGNLAPVFDAMLEKAMHLCGAAFGTLRQFDGVQAHLLAAHGLPTAFAEHAARHPVTPRDGLLRSLGTGQPLPTLDIRDLELYKSGDPDLRAIGDLGGARTVLNVPLFKAPVSIGYFTLYRQDVRAFTDKQIALIENFAAQAVIAMENARLLNEIRQRQAELRITFENMGDGVAMFDETPRLVAWNGKFQEIFNVPDVILEEHRTYVEYVRYLGTRGDFGPSVDVEEQIRRLTEIASEYHAYERIRPDGRVIEIRHNPVPGGGFVLIYADITERKRSEAEIRAARDAAEEASRTIEAAYRDLKAAQANLIQAEKMASLGQLTAGIAHEIKNPLNFVNNFAALSVDLLSELKDTAAPGLAALTEKQRTEVEEVSVMLTSNLEKITEHGKRADSIVKAMLEHSRGSSGERRMVDLNALIDEALNLAYHGARAQDQSFNITLERDFDEGIAPIEVNPQDITRVFLNLFANGFYAVTKRAREGGDAGFAPTLKVTTIDAGEAVEIRVRDNGTGIPVDIRDKLFQPFFTTKPTGEGTGLGLSITYDIVTQQHGGTIAADSMVGDYSEFTIRLPRNP